MAELELDQLVNVVLRRVADRLGQMPDRSRDEWQPALLVAGNWKMNAPGGGAGEALVEFASHLALASQAGVDTLVFPPATLISSVRSALAGAGASTEVGSQDLHWEPSGAHTGEVSADLVLAAGATWTLVGHSERRAAGETHDQVKAKLRRAVDSGLSAVLCVGEGLDDRTNGSTFRVLRVQVQTALAGLALRGVTPGRLAIAYEPVWAIGTGRLAEPAQIDEACAFIRTVAGEEFGAAWASRLRVLYGGSVTEDSAADILAVEQVGGLLVGGASLSPKRFAAIVEAGAARARSLSAQGGGS